MLEEYSSVEEYETYQNHDIISNSMSQDTLVILMVIMLVGSILIVPVCVALLWYALTRPRLGAPTKAQQLKQNGKLINTTFKEVYQTDLISGISLRLLMLGSTMKVPQLIPSYKITSTWVDPNTKQTYTFNSANILKELKNFTTTQPIAVYINPTDLSDYHMDVDQLVKEWDK